jgi:hypothetical protein
VRGLVYAGCVSQSRGPGGLDRAGPMKGGSVVIWMGLARWSQERDRGEVRSAHGRGLPCGLCLDGRPEGEATVDRGLVKVGKVEREGAANNDDMVVCFRCGGESSCGG